MSQHTPSSRWELSTWGINLRTYDSHLCFTVCRVTPYLGLKTFYYKSKYGGVQTIVYQTIVEVSDSYKRCGGDTFDYKCGFTIMGVHSCNYNSINIYSLDPLLVTNRFITPVSYQMGVYNNKLDYYTHVLQKSLLYSSSNHLVHLSLLVKHGLLTLSTMTLYSPSCKTCLYPHSVVYRLWLTYIFLNPVQPVKTSMWPLLTSKICSFTSL